MTDTITVAEFVADAKQHIEQQQTAVWVRGEVANFTRAASGHWYFVLRDEHCQIDCIMLVRQNRLADATPKNGDSIEVFGSAALYAPRARFQLAVRFLRFGGVGRLYQLFVERKAQWQARGWFARARALPPMPQTVGVVCSTAGAALHDVLRTLRQRYALLRVVIYPAPAQGEGAADKIAAAINRASTRGDADVLLLVRGGGGMEDLWAYNEEPVVAAIVDCQIPIISGIGHETDTTLADYAADKTCPTPTAAAQAAVPEAAVLQQQLIVQQRSMSRCLQSLVDEYSQQLDWQQRLLVSPQQLLLLKQQKLKLLQAGLVAAMQSHLSRQQQRLALAKLPAAKLPPAAQMTLADMTRRLQQAGAARLAAYSNQCTRQEERLHLLSPQNLLQQGYSIVSNAAGAVVRRVGEVKDGEAVNICLSDGSVRAVVNQPSD